MNVRYVIHSFNSCMVYTLKLILIAMDRPNDSQSTTINAISENKEKDSVDIGGTVH